jgi:hypothetical protein
LRSRGCLTVRSEEEWGGAKLLESGEAFGPSRFFTTSEACLVLSSLTPPAIFDEGIARVRGFSNGR